MAYIGNAPAAGILSGDNIQDGTVGTNDLANSAVTTAKIADGGVHTAKIADNAVSAAKLHTTAVTDKLGYTPVNKAGDTMTGDLALPNLNASLNLKAGSGYVSPLFYINTGVAGGFIDLNQGDIYNIKDVASPGNLSAMFNGQFSPYTQSDESMNWQQFRLIFRSSRNTATYDNITVTFVGVSYYYSTGWAETGSTFQFNGTDGERGYRWVVSPWYTSSNFSGGFDVPGFGIKLKTSTIPVRVGSLYLQYRR